MQAAKPHTSSQIITHAHGQASVHLTDDKRFLYVFLIF